MGGNKVFKLTDRGDKWEAISGDLTTNHPEKNATTGSNAETFCTIVSLAESPKQKGVLWSGSDDGLIQLTQNDGKDWKNVTPSEIRGLYVAKIDASTHDAKVAYVAIDGHRSNHYEPLVLMTRDLGSTWKNITTNLPKGASVRSIREDSRSAGVLYVGTETGIYASINTGASWVKLNTGTLPTVGVHDIAQQSREMDLVVATHGRSVWVMDDMSPLSQLTPKLIQKPLAALKSIPARVELRGFIDGLWGDKHFAAPNKPTGARIHYWLRDKVDSVLIKVENAKGETMAELTGTGKAGINRVTWDLKLKPDVALPNKGEEASEIFVPAGTYSVTVTAGEHVDKTTVVVLASNLGGSSVVPSRAKHIKDRD